MLSKSKYCAFVQCPKNLWLGVNKPELAVKDPSAESRMEEGNVIGDLAMQLFGDFVEVTAYKADGKLDLTKMITDTKELMDKKAPVICEASFSYNGDYCAVDILKREGDGYAIYEVKSSTGSKDVYITDISYQKYVLEHSGVNVDGTYLVCINSDYVFNGELKLNELFEIVDVSDEVAEKISSVEENIRDANEVLSEKCEPDLDLSIGCHKPYDCAFWKYCSRHLPSPSVFDLYGTGFGFEKKLDYYKNGVRSFEEAARDKTIM
jgi:CRISPR/Cas system-associated exonuclease Cas4 (RecB family)